MTLFSDFCDAEIATLERLVPTPVEPFGYGNDLSCVTDLTADLAEVDPFSIQGLAETAVRFLTSERDSIPDAPGRGYNVRRLLNRALTPLEIIAQEGLIAAELEQDEDRFEEVSASLVLTGRSLAVTFTIQPSALTGLEAFSFVLAVTDSTTLIEGLR
jgi:hypothetical protein